MDGSSLFPTNQSLLEGALGAPAPLVQFKAGLMSHNLTTNLVTPDPRKGMLQIVTSPDDNMPHLQWRARPGRSVEQDLIVIPGEAEMKLVASAHARVYVLKWLGTTTKMFFWMQGGDASEDARHIATVNRVLGLGPPTTQGEVQQPPVPPPGVRIPEQATEADIREARASLPLPAGAGVAAPDEEMTTPPPPTDAPTPAAGGPSAAEAPITLDAFSRMLDAMPSVQRQTAGSLASARRAALTEPTVGDLLRSPELADALRAPGVRRALPALFDHLPEKDRDVEKVAEVMRCPQVLAQAGALARALGAGEGADLLRALGLEEAGGDAIGMQALLEALRKVQEKE